MMEFILKGVIGVAFIVGGTLFLTEVPKKMSSQAINITTIAAGLITGISLALMVRKYDYRLLFLCMFSGLTTMKYLFHTDISRTKGFRIASVVIASLIMIGLMLLMIVIIVKQTR